MFEQLVTFFTEPFAYGFMQYATIASLAGAIVCALLSCWLVLIGWSLMGDAVSHAVLPGVVLAYVVGMPFAIGAVVFAFIAIWMIGGISSPRIKQDAAIGIVFTTLFALGLVLISVTPSQTDLGHIVFGNVLGIGTSELVQILIIAVVVIAVLLIKRRDFTAFAFDRRYLDTLGISSKRLSTLLLALMALTTVAALQIVGVILVVAMLITPGATARLLTNRFNRMLWIAPIVAVISVIFGIYISFYMDVATGPMIVLVQGILFGCAYTASLLRIRKANTATV